MDIHYQHPAPTSRAPTPPKFAIRVRVIHGADKFPSCGTDISLRAAEHSCPPRRLLVAKANPNLRNQVPTPIRGRHIQPSKVQLRRLEQ